MALRLVVVMVLGCGCGANSASPSCPAVAEGVTAIDPLRLDARCTMAADCVGVRTGEQCGACSCSAINVGELACYQQLKQSIDEAACPSADDCGCGPRAGLCQNGACVLQR